MYYSTFFSLRSHTTFFHTFNLPTLFDYCLNSIGSSFFLVSIPNTRCVVHLTVVHHLSFKLPPKVAFLLCDVLMGAEDLES